MSVLNGRGAESRSFNNPSFIAASCVVIRSVPFVMQTALSDFYVEYQLNANIQHPEERLKVLAELHTHIQDVFNEHEVQIMSPHYRMDPPQPVIAPRDTWNTTPPPPSDASPPPTT